MGVAALSPFLSTLSQALRVGEASSIHDSGRTPFFEIPQMASEIPWNLMRSYPPDLVPLPSPHIPCPRQGHIYIPGVAQLCCSPPPSPFPSPPQAPPLQGERHLYAFPLGVGNIDVGSKHYPYKPAISSSYVNTARQGVYRKQREAHIDLALGAALSEPATVRDHICPK